MRIRRALLAICGAAIVVLATSAGGNAAASRTYVTFNQPVGLPGVSLASGTYVFERVGNSQDMVRVTGSSNRIVYLTAFTSEITRPSRGPRSTDIVFGESPSGHPRPVKAWFPEDSLTGRAFIYR